MRVAFVLGKDDAVALDGGLVGRTSGRSRALVVGSSSGVAFFLVLRGNGAVAGVALRGTLEKVEFCHCLKDGNNTEGRIEVELVLQRGM